MQNVKMSVTTDAAGNGHVRKAINGILLAASIDYTGTQACTVTIREVMSDGFTRTLLSVPSANTDIHRALVRLGYDSANVSTGHYVPQVVGGQVEINVSGATANVPNAVVVHLQIEGSAE